MGLGSLMAQGVPVEWQAGCRAEPVLLESGMLLSFPSPWRPVLAGSVRHYLVLQITGIPNLQSTLKTLRRVVEAGRVWAAVPAQGCVRNSLKLSVPFFPLFPL